MSYRQDKPLQVEKGQHMILKVNWGLFNTL
jgi:hypothetical protein